MKKLENFTILDVPDNIVPEVARTVAATEKIGIKLKWIDKVIGDTCSKRDHFTVPARESVVHCSTRGAPRGDG